MKDVENCHYTDSIMYLMKQTVVYAGIKGAQVLSSFGLDITIDQFAALDAIYCNANICQRDLSKLLLKDRSNTGRILNILEENGYIERAAETKNNRLIKKIYITQKGKNLIEQNHPKLKNEFLKVFEEVTDEEFASFKNTLTKLKNSLSQTTSIQI